MNDHHVWGPPTLGISQEVTNVTLYFKRKWRTPILWFQLEPQNGVKVLAYPI